MLSRLWKGATGPETSVDEVAKAQLSRFASPASVTLDELVKLRDLANAVRRSSYKKSSAQSAGPSVSQRLGRGLDFAEVRQYQAGDDIRMIDWKVTARSGQAHTKLFVEERERPVMLVVDTRSHMRFGTQGMFKSVLATRLAAVLGWHAVANQDRVGGFVFSDSWHAEIRPRSGRRSLMNLFQAMAQAQEQAPNVDAHDASLVHSLTRLRQTVHAGSMVILLSDFLGFNDQARSALGSMLHKLDIIAVQIADPIEFQLPSSGQYALATIQHSIKQNLHIDTSQANVIDYSQVFHDRTQDLAHYFAGYRHTHLSARTDQPLLDTAIRIVNRVPDARQDKHG